MRAKGNGEVLSRIEFLLGKNGKKDKDLIEYLGLRLGTFAEWKRGKGYSNMLYIKEICDFFHVTPNYLFLGEEISLPPGQDFDAPEERDLIESYRKMESKEKGYLKVILPVIAGET